MIVNSVNQYLQNHNYIILNKIFFFFDKEKFIFNYYCSWDTFFGWTIFFVFLLNVEQNSKNDIKKKWKLIVEQNNNNGNVVACTVAQGNNWISKFDESIVFHWKLTIRWPLPRIWIWIECLNFYGCLLCV